MGYLVNVCRGELLAAFSYNKIFYVVLLYSFLSPALSALREIVEDEKESAGSRIAAARSLLEYGLRLTEFNDILRDLEGVE